MPCRPSDIKFVVPAQPGYFILTPLHELSGGIKEAHRHPVVAFAIDADGCTHPITLDYIEDHGDPSILTPDGAVHSYSNTWEDEAQWLEEARAVDEHHKSPAAARR